MSRIVAGTFALEMQSIDLRQIVSATIEALQPAAQAKGVTIAPALEASGRLMRGDPARLQQVVSNLISNAIKFTAAGGRIDVLSKNGGHVNVNGRLDASAPTQGNGGFIETSADTVNIAGGTIVTTASTGRRGDGLVFVLPVEQAVKIRTGQSGPAAFEA